MSEESKEEILTFRKVYCKDRLPAKNGTYFTGWDDEWEGEIYTVCIGSNWYKEKEFEVDEPDEPNHSTQPTWWLEEISYKNQFPQEVTETALREAFEAGRRPSMNLVPTYEYPTFEDYKNSRGK